MKPIFQKEKEFLIELLGIELPDGCWRDASKIYLSPYNKKPALIFKVDQGICSIQKNEITPDSKSKSLQELIELNIDRLQQLEKQAISKILYFIGKYPEHKVVLSYSAGKDSDAVLAVMKLAAQEQPIDYSIDFMNTTNETADTYRHLKQDTPQDKLTIINPEKGWYQWLKEDKNYFIPSVMVRNCCSKYKEGRAKEFYNKDEKILFLQGIRKDESVKRSKYIEEFKRDDMGKRDWVYALPILEWKDIDIWLYILWKNLKINEQYYKGFSRCGCLICPYMRNYNALLIRKYYPAQYQRWVGILKKNYQIYHIGERLKWTLEEWISGAWREGVGKEYNLISRKPTKENIWKLAEMKGVTYDIAEKYFQRSCKCCGKSLNNHEIGFMLKITNRKIDLDQMFCRSCYCKEFNVSKKEYQEMILMWINAGCKLF